MALRIGTDGGILERYARGEDTGIRAPRVLADLYEQWDSLENAPFLPQGDEPGLQFERLGGFLLEEKLLGFDITDHGNSLYSKLMELNPNSEILTVQNTAEGGIFPWKKFRSSDRKCLLDRADRAQEIREIFARLTEDVVSLAKQYGIDYIQLTTGDHADCNGYRNKILAHPANFLPQLVIPKEGLNLDSEVPAGIADAEIKERAGRGSCFLHPAESSKPSPQYMSFGEIQCPWFGAKVSLYPSSSECDRR